MFLMGFLLCGQEFKFVVGVFPDLDGAVRGAGEKVGCFGGVFVEIGEVGINPLVFFKTIKVNIPRNTVNDLIVCLNVFNELKFTVINSYGAIGECDSKETLDFAGVEGEMDRNAVELDFPHEGKGFGLELIQSDMLVDARGGQEAELGQAPDNFKYGVVLEVLFGVVGVNEVGLLGEVVAFCVVEQNVALGVAEGQDAPLVVVLCVEDY
jgi:hypothetical protein